MVNGTLGLASLNGLGQALSPSASAETNTVASTIDPLLGCLTSALITASAPLATDVLVASAARPTVIITVTALVTIGHGLTCIAALTAVMPPTATAVIPPVGLLTSNDVLAASVALVARIPLYAVSLPMPVPIPLRRVVTWSADKESVRRRWVVSDRVLAT